MKNLNIIAVILILFTSFFAHTAMATGVTDRSATWCGYKASFQYIPLNTNFHKKGKGLSDALEACANVKDIVYEYSNIENGKYIGACLMPLSVLKANLESCAKTCNDIKGGGFRKVKNKSPEQKLACNRCYTSLKYKLPSEMKSGNPEGYQSIFLKSNSEGAINCLSAAPN